MRNASETLSLSAPINTCREMAASAMKLAVCDVAPERRAKFLDLARQWNELADEMERAMASLEVENHDEPAVDFSRCDSLSDRL
jgi:hypothetical protein